MGGGFRIYGDWGTSAARFYLCEDTQNPTPIETLTSNRGIMRERQAEACFHELTAPWSKRYSIGSATLCGMVGAAIGWKEVPYVSLPALNRDLAKSASRFESNGISITIVPGLECDSLFGTVDTLRGEETQIVGARILNDRSLVSPVVCLPGTHCKWAVCSSDSIETFFTGFSGELFELLSAHSILLTDLGDSPFDVSSFQNGLETAFSNEHVDLMHMVFSTRAMQVAGRSTVNDRRSYLSGLIIGKDVAGALAALERSVGSVDSISVVGESRLCDLYGRALALAGCKYVTVDGHEAALAGLHYLSSLIEVS